MRKDITKKFLMREDRYASKMLSKDVFFFIFRKKINIDAKQVGYDEIEFRNMFSTKSTDLNTNNLFSLKYNMIYCCSGKSNSAFLLGETEVTQELYKLVMGYNPSFHPMDEKTNANLRPVENVTWYDAIMFCNKLSLLMRKIPYYDIKNIRHDYYIRQNIRDASVKINEGANGFRLPLSKEWEYAAKAGTNNRWSGTNNESELEEYAWFDKNSNHDTHPVATKKPNEWGFYDMSGNVEEWCGDKYNNNSNEYVICGGDHLSDPFNLLSNNQSKNSPNKYNGLIGFRVAASL